MSRECDEFNFSCLAESSWGSVAAFAHDSAAVSFKMNNDPRFSHRSKTHCKHRIGYTVTLRISLSENARGWWIRCVVFLVTVKACRERSESSFIRISMDAVLRDLSVCDSKKRVNQLDTAYRLIKNEQHIHTESYWYLEWWIDDRARSFCKAKSSFRQTKAWLQVHVRRDVC